MPQIEARRRRGGVRSYWPNPSVLMDTWFALPYGPLLIFAMRVVDVSMGTVRLILMVRGWRNGAATVSFFEVLVWIVAVGHAMRHLTSPYHLVGYAGGFATGTYVGVSVEHALALGQVAVRAILPNGDGGRVARALREAGYAVTEIDGRGREGPVDLVNIVVTRRNAEGVAVVIEEVAPRSFITVEEVRSARRGVLRPIVAAGRQHVRK